MTGYRATSGALQRIPTGISLPVARGIFLGGYWAWPQKRHIIEANAARVLRLPEDHPDVKRLARRMYRTYAEFVVELMRLPGLSADAPTQLVREADSEGGSSFLALWEQYRSEGRGIVGVTGHIGSIEVLAGAFAAQGLPTYGLADDTAYPELFALLNRSRARWKVGIIPWRNLRETFRVLRLPAVLGLVVDWGYRRDDIPVQLFGRWTTLPAGPALLAAKTRAVIVPVVNRRQPDGTYVASHDRPIEVGGSSPAEILRATQAVADALERMVAAAPDQWYTFKPVWPATPADEAHLQTRARTMAAGDART
ncbi:MAG: lysophospholipid acyltransferase family protein [Chloroflexota bacterium]|nr:lysophospholipid acyltransferase family protein [Chloroflexota bacterium]